jgi:8-oxo-dGTP diphosphatase
MPESINQFTIRVYGLIINDENQLLVSDEYCRGVFMTKFPGGGLEFGEGLLDCLKREFREECDEEIEVIEHFYTTDFMQVSAFHTSAQLISIYYKVRFSSNPKLNFATVPFEGLNQVDDTQVFRWISLANLSVEQVTWPVDRTVVSILLKEFNS